MLRGATESSDFPVPHSRQHRGRSGATISRWPLLVVVCKVAHLHFLRASTFVPILEE